MKHHRTITAPWAATLLLTGSGALAGALADVEGSPPAAAPPASSPAAPPSSRATDPMDAVNTVAHDRAVWQQLLSDHGRIRRVVVHRNENGLGIVEATTESDDPAVAARIIEHAKAMQARMVAGARVRVWDPVFAELFARHDKATLEVTVTPQGVRIVESSRDPETIALLRSHAMGLSDFVREGHEAGGRETPRLAVDAPLPPPEVAIGGVPHRFLLSQPDAAQLGLLRHLGVDTVVNFRTPAEQGTSDEQAESQALGMQYCGIPYRQASQLTDAVLDEARAQLRAAATAGTTLALHCRTGNRVGPGWAAYLALDRGSSVEAAIASAKAVGMVDPPYESVTRDYIRRQRAARTESDAAWRRVDAARSPAQQTQQRLAVEARDAVFSRLLARLAEAMAAPGADGRPNGAGGAIDVCRREAPAIAQAVGREKGVMIGRTSDRLRNPGNVAPSWARGLLADRPREEVISLNVDGSLGVLLPITIAPTCLACHGAPDRLDPAVREALATAYPDDAATGYAAGDLRGWFWIEVPPTMPKPRTSHEQP